MVVTYTIRKYFYVLTSICSFYVLTTICSKVTCMYCFLMYIKQTQKIVRDKDEITMIFNVFKKLTFILSLVHTLYTFSRHKMPFWWGSSVLAVAVSLRFR